MTNVVWDNREKCNNIVFDSWQFRTESLISLKSFNPGCLRKTVFMRIKLKTYLKFKKVHYFNTFKFWASQVRNVTRHSIISCIGLGVCVCVSHLDHEVVLLVHLAHTPHHLTLLCLHSNRPRGRVLSALGCECRPVAAVVHWEGEVSRLETSRRPQTLPYVQGLKSTFILLCHILRTVFPQFICGYVCVNVCVSSHFVWVCRDVRRTASEWAAVCPSSHRHCCRILREQRNGPVRTHRRRVIILILPLIQRLMSCSFLTLRFGSVRSKWQAS